MVMLAVEEITSGYVEEIDILSDVSVKVRRNSITGIIGPNGAGKSTLLKTIFGFLYPRKGKIFFEGSEIQNNPPYRLKQMGIGYMLQEFSTFPDLTVEDNLLLGAWILRHDRKFIKRRLDEIYQAFPHLAARRKQKANYMSGGVLRILSVAKEIMTNPRLLMCDEPSAGLAPIVVKEIYDLLTTIAKQGTTILLVDQNIMKALEVSAYMCLLEMGRVKQTGPKKEFEESIREIIRQSLVSD
jgi:ABC-type branched-subunit amino acid transport system ATPase component